MLKKERIKTINNLTIAYGETKSPEEIREMAKEVFTNLGRGAAELAIKLNVNDPDEYFSNVEVIGKEHAEKAYERGKGIINIVPHLGCWEALSKAYTMLGYSAGAVVKNLKNEKLNNWVISHREFNGFKVLPRGSTYKTILQFLKQNNSLGMLIDQDTAVKSVFVDFYGKPAYTPIGAAMLALDSDATVFTTSYIRTEGHHYRFVFGEAMEVIRTGNRQEELQLNTERFHAAVEKQIMEYPTQWVWMHERWKTTPEIVEKREQEKQELRKRRREERMKNEAGSEG
jgi:KDO2-lipid IV(A) lauroyltransferase